MCNGISKHITQSPIHPVNMYISIYL